MYLLVSTSNSLLRQMKQWGITGMDTEVIQAQVQSTGTLACTGKRAATIEVLGSSSYLGPSHLRLGVAPGLGSGYPATQSALGMCAAGPRALAGPPTPPTRPRTRQQ